LIVIFANSNFEFSLTYGEPSLSFSRITNHVIYLRSFFEKYESHSNNLKYLRRIISIMASSNSVDNPNGIYEYDIDSEIAKIKKLLFKLVSRTDSIF
jgi:hypothetical protein